MYVFIRGLRLAVEWQTQQGFRGVRVPLFWDDVQWAIDFTGVGGGATRVEVRAPPRSDRLSLNMDRR